MRTLLIPVLMLCGVTLALAQPFSFTEHVQTTELFGANTLDVYDMDGDKDLDIIATAQTSGAITWWENDDSLHMVFHRHEVGFADAPSRVTAGDLDGDGAPDIVCAFDYGDEIIWWRNRGDDWWEERPIIENYSEARMVQLVDMDGDDDLDIVTCGQWTVSWLENDGNEIFSLHNIDTNIPGTAMVVAEDFDEDGDQDIFAVAYWWGEAVYYENTGANSFNRVNVDPNLEDPHWIEPADVDLDGDIDLLVSSRSDNQVFWYEFTDGPWVRHLITNDVIGPQGMAAADYDRDGDWDFVAAARTGGDLSAWGNVGTDFAGEIVRQDLGMPGMVAAADFDRDNDMDFVATYWGANTLSVWENSTSDGENPPDEFWIDLEPDASTTTLPAMGGQVVFDVAIHNPAPVAVSGLAWMGVELPDGSLFTLPNAVPVTIPANSTRVYPDRSLNVPWLAGPGLYRLYGYIGLEYPYPIDDDDFLFEKLPFAGGEEASGSVSWSALFLDDQWQEVSIARDVPTSLPTALTLYPAHPNPFNASTTVSLALPETGPVQVRVRDLLGREVMTLHTGALSAGQHRWVVDGSQLASGSYFVHALAGGKSRIVKLVLLK